MLVFGLGINKDIIDVDDNELVEVLMEDGVHEPHEGSWGIRETEGHDGILVGTITSNEGHLRNVLLSDLDLMVTWPQIQLGEDGSTAQLIEQIIYPRNRVFVLDRHRIQWPVIDDQSRDFGVSS